MRFHRLFLSSVCCLAFLSFAPTPSAQAAGFYIQEQSVSGLGRAFAGSAAHPVDSSTVYTNPAGMTYLKQAQAQADVTLLTPNADFKNDGSTAATTLTGGASVAVNNSGDGGNPYTLTAVPSFYLVQPIKGTATWLGIGVTAPFGLSNKYDTGWFGRYDSTSSDLKVIDIAPSVAFKANEMLSFGMGVNIQYANADLRRAIPDPLQAGGPTAANDGLLTLKGQDWAIGVNAGLIFQPRKDTRIALHYRSEVNHDIKGNLSGVTPAGIGGGVTFHTGGHAGLDLPQMATLAIAHDLNEKLTLLAHAAWIGWSSFQAINLKLDSGSNLVDEQDYEDSVSIALGAEYKTSDRWTLRTGIQFDETPTTSKNRTTRTPDGNRTWLSGGATYNISDRVSLDMGATYIFISDGHVDRTANFSPLYSMFGAGGASAVVHTRGTAASHVGLAGLALNYKF